MLAIGQQLSRPHNTFPLILLPVTTSRGITKPVSITPLIGSGLPLDYSAGVDAAPLVLVDIARIETLTGIGAQYRLVD